MTVVAQASFGFGSPYPYPGIAALDVEGDGDSDIAVATGTGSPALVLNGGPAGLVVVPQPVPFGIGRLYAQPRDVDGDGDADLLSASLANGIVSLSVARNDGRGRFSTPNPAGAYTGILGRAIWADLDGDGDSDLWVTTFGPTAQADALLNDGTGLFASAASFPIAGPVGALAAADFDGDTDVDIVMGKVTSGGFPPTFHRPALIRSLHAQTGVVSFAPAVMFGATEAIRDLAVLDAGADGDLDLIAATVQFNGAPGTPRLFLNDGVGGFGVTFPVAGAVAATVAAGDLNGDSAVDAVLGGQVWMLSGGNLVPTSSHATPLDLIALADFDEDGTLDLLDSAGRWYPGTPAGAFSAPIDITPYPPGGPIALAAPKPDPLDLDADGDLDLAGPDNLFGLGSSIYFNLTRHAGPTSLVSRNATVTAAVWGDASAPWLLAASAPGAPPQALPPFGTLFLDLGTVVIVSSGTIPPGGRADLSGFLGGSVAPGIAMSWQALVGSSLTNAFDTVVLP
jgi:hypothetical protein